MNSENLQVEGSLKSARLTHWMLVLVCATILVAIHQRENYSEAIKELDAIIIINLEQFVHDSIQETNKLARDSEFAIDWSSGFDLLMRAELDKIGLIVSNSKIHVLAFLTSFDIERVRSLQKTSLIRDYEDFLIENIGIDFVDFGASIVAKAFAEELKDPNILRRDFLPGTKIVSAIFNMDPPFHDPSGTKNFSTEMLFAFQFEELKRPPVKINIKAPPVWSSFTFEDTTFQNWLKKHQILRKLVDGEPRGGKFYTAESIFPKLKLMWSEIKDKTPKEAKRLLSEKEKRKISFFGVEIDIPMVVVAGPLLVLLILLYLICLVSHLECICERNLDSLRTFPWISMFDGIIARSLCMVSIVVLPTLTLILLYLKFRDINGWQPYVPLITSALSFFISIKLLYCIHDLKKRCR